MQLLLGLIRFNIHPSKLHPPDRSLIEALGFLWTIQRMNLHFLSLSLLSINLILAAFASNFAVG